MMNNYHSRTAQIIAAELETNESIIVDVTTEEQDSHIFQVMIYLTRYFSKYYIKYFGDGTAMIRKQE